VHVLEAAGGNVLFFVLEVLDNDGVAGADLETIGLHALAEEERDTFLLAQVDMRLHMDAACLPEVIQVLLAEPLFR